MHGIQAWVALPSEEEETDPHFSNHAGAELPTYEDNGVWLRLIAGELEGMKAGARTHSPMFYAHVTLNAGTTFAMRPDYSERAAYVVAGEVTASNRQFGVGQMLVFAPNVDAVVSASKPAILMVLGGEPVGERHIEWNFVSSSRERIEQAKADWRAGRMKLPDLDNDEFIPLPPDPPPPANPIS